MKQDSSKEIFTEMQRTNRMDCAQFQEVLHELGRPESEGAMLCERALAHAETCSACATLLTEVESLDFSLREMVEETSESASAAETGNFVAAGISAREIRGDLAAPALAVGGDRRCRGDSAGAGSFTCTGSNS